MAEDDLWSSGNLATAPHIVIHLPVGLVQVPTLFLRHYEYYERINDAVNTISGFRYDVYQYRADGADNSSYVAVLGLLGYHGEYFRACIQ